MHLTDVCSCFVDCMSTVCGQLLHQKAWLVINTCAAAEIATSLNPSFGCIVRVWMLCIRCVKPHRLRRILTFENLGLNAISMWQSSTDDHS